MDDHDEMDVKFEECATVAAELASMIKARFDDRPASSVGAGIAMYLGVYLYACGAPTIEGVLDLVRASYAEAGAEEPEREVG